MTDRISLTPREAAAATGLSLRVIQEAYQAEGPGALPCHYVSPRRIRILVKDLEVWLASFPTEQADAS